MGFPENHPDILRARAKGLIAGEVAPKGKPARRELVAPAFIAPNIWVVPVYVVAGDNIGGGGSRAKIGRAGHERTATARVLATALRELAHFAETAQRGDAVRCRLIRLGKREMDYANLVAAMKYVQDTVALFLGVGDSPRDPIIWEYAQETGGAFGVRIELTAEDAS